jgi:hypothetical protein
LRSFAAKKPCPNGHGFDETAVAKQHEEIFNPGGGDPILDFLNSRNTP